MRRSGRCFGLDLLPSMTMSTVSKVGTALVHAFLWVVVVPLALMWLIFFKTPVAAFRWIRARVSLAVSDIKGLPKFFIDAASLIILLNGFALALALFVLVGIGLDVLRGISEWLSGPITHPLLLIVLLAAASGASWLFDVLRRRTRAKRS
jgi:hypothetical protein